MDKVARLPAPERNALFAETAAAMRTVPAIVEKDFWVVWVLDKLFSAPRQNELEKDYQAMQVMIFDKRIPFAELIATLTELERDINALARTV